MTHIADIYGGLHPRDVPCYRVPEAARYLGLPSSTLRAWTFGQRSRGQRFHRVIGPQDPVNGLLSFTNLVEAHVLSSLRSHYRIPLPRIRRALAYLSKITDKKRPLADLPLMTDGASLFVRAYGEGMLDASSLGQFTMEAIVKAYLKRVEADESGVIRFYPFTRKAASVELPDLEQHPRTIVIDPRISFGKPVIARTNIRTAIIWQRYLAGESVESLAADYDRPLLEIEEAIRCEALAAA